MLIKAIYDVLTLLVVMFYIGTYVYILKDASEKGIVRTLFWCVVNLCLPLIGFVIYCAFYRRKDIEKSI